MQGELKSKSASYVIQTNVDGVIKKILVKVGESISANQPVAEIDSEELKTEIEVLTQTFNTNLQNIDELNVAKKSLEKQYDSLLKEFLSYKTLLKDGYTTEDQLLSLENRKFDIEYKIKVLESDIEVKKERISKQMKN